VVAGVVPSVESKLVVAVRAQTFSLLEKRNGPGSLQRYESYAAPNRDHNLRSHQTHRRHLVDP